MAEIIEEASEIIDGAEESVSESTEGLEDLTEEEKAEIEAAVTEAKEEISSFSKITKELTEIIEAFKGPLKNLFVFIAQNSAIGAILWAVNSELNKLFSRESKKDRSKKSDVLKALLSVIETENEISNKAIGWIKDHQDDTVIIDTFELPLESLMIKYLSPVTKAVDEVYKVAKTFSNKVGACVQWMFPNAEDIKQLLNAAETFLKSFSDLIEFVSNTKSKFPALASFPVTQEDMEHLKTKIETAKGIPLW